MAINQQLKEDVLKIVAQGGTPEDINWYVESQGVSPGEFFRRPITESQIKFIQAQQELKPEAGDTFIKRASKAALRIGGRTPEQILDTLTTKTPIKTAIKQSIVETAKIAPLLIPGPKGGKIFGEGGKVAGKKLLKEFTKVSTGVAASRAVEKLAELEGPIRIGPSSDMDAKQRQIAKEAAFEGITSGLIAAGIPLAGKGLAQGTKALFSATSQVRAPFVKYALKKPEVITKKQKLITEVAGDIQDSINKYDDAIGESFDKKMSALKPKVKKGTKIPTKSARDSLAKKDVDLDDLKSTLNTVRSKEAVKLKERVVGSVVKNGKKKPIKVTAIDDFIEGKPIDFEEAVKMNRILRGAGQAPAQEVFTGLKGKIASSKSILLKDIEDKVPGVKGINKAFAKRKNEVKDLKKLFGADELSSMKKEGKLIDVASDLLGEKKKNVVVFQDRLKRLDRITKSNNLENLKDSVVADGFAKVGASNMFNTVRGGLGAGIGYTLGGFPGSVAGGIAAGAITSPGATEAGILATRGIAGGLRAAGVPQTASILTRGAAVAPRQSLNEIVFGSQGGQ